jgi:hypothetical protein
MVSASVQKLISSVLDVVGFEVAAENCSDSEGVVLPHVLLGYLAVLFCDAAKDKDEARASAVISSLEHVMREYDDEVYELVQVGFLEMVRNICGLHQIESRSDGKLKMMASSM